MRAAVLLCLCMLAPSSVLAGKLYRCADGSFQDKPCVEGGGTVVGSNRPAPKIEGDKACIEAGKRAEQIAQSRVDGMPLEQLLADIDTRNEPYERRLEQKKLAVQVYQSNGTPLEARVVGEADCVAAKSKAVPAPSAAAPAPSTAASREPSTTDLAAIEARRKADAEAVQRNRCEMYRGELAAVRRSQGTKTSIEESERLSLKKRELDKKVWEVCG